MATRGCACGMRPFHVGPKARDAWLQHMRVAVDNLDLPDHAEDLLWDYLLMAANSMVNSVDDPDGDAAQTVGTAPRRADTV